MERKEGAHLVVNGVKLGKEDSVNGAGSALLGVVQQGLVEAGQLIHCLIAHQSLTHKQDKVRGVHSNQLPGEGGERG